METVRLPRTIVNQLLAHAQRFPDTEVCGLIGARDGRPATCYPVDNAAAEPSRLFEMDPHEQIEVMRHMREAGESLFAIYHSHPHSPPEPSATDLEQAAYPEALYLIISLDTKGVLQMKGFRLIDNRATPVELEICET